MVEGFLADTPHFVKLYKKILERIQASNEIRANSGGNPIHLVISAAAQHVASNANMRNFVADAIATTDVTIHANTGEFRRLMDNDEVWRQEFNDRNNDPFRGLSGEDLETAKKDHPAYRDAKVLANKATLERAKALVELAKEEGRELRFVVTDGGHDAYVLDMDDLIIITPPKLDMSTVVNKVGAGDAFMAGFWIGELLGLKNLESMMMGYNYAAEIMQQGPARFEPGDVMKIANDVLDEESGFDGKPAEPELV
jgi:sugar/nucleoside kinase (ribokinase family)